ncbi:hypothetical protein [Jannaschia rubra]|uniref:Uncharacterized protein n=1 Tax=Jannaschia rubra TaxID=282197 RepID=A0A0M6XNA7_9RHOB|nr:hypothetical protein [Jannaschia rubra]CTQ31663.1 hypothetical protein JAN5088_00421 [Jannaschia rubra]SFG82417.1 hypothetical protein SAMN04488517_11915 [Jannaschia rubra]
MNPTPYITHHQLSALIEADYLVDVVCMAEPYFKEAVWYGKWVIQVPEQRGESERFLVSARGKEGPHLRTFKTGYGLISFMWKLGFRTIGLPMEEGTSVSYRIGSEPAAKTGPGATATEERAPLSFEAIRTGLLLLANHGFVPVWSAIQLIKAGYAVPVEVEVTFPHTWPDTVNAIRLTDAGRTTASMLAERGASPVDPPNPIPDWERVISESYIRQKADEGVLAKDIICAKEWYPSPIEPERRTMEQMPVRFPIAEWKGGAGHVTDNN